MPGRAPRPTAPTPSGGGVGGFTVGVTVVTVATVVCLFALCAVEVRAASMTQCALGNTCADGEFCVQDAATGAPSCHSCEAYPGAGEGWCWWAPHYSWDWQTGAEEPEGCLERCGITLATSIDDVPETSEGAYQCAFGNECGSDEVCVHEDASNGCVACPSEVADCVIPYPDLLYNWQFGTAECEKRCFSEDSSPSIDYFELAHTGGGSGGDGERWSYSPARRRFRFNGVASAAACAARAMDDAATLGFLYFEETQVCHLLHTLVEKSGGTSDIALSYAKLDEVVSAANAPADGAFVIRHTGGRGGTGSRFSRSAAYVLGDGPAAEDVSAAECIELATLNPLAAAVSYEPRARSCTLLNYGKSIASGDNVFRVGYERRVHDGAFRLVHTGPTSGGGNGRRYKTSVSRRAGEVVDVASDEACAEQCVLLGTECTGFVTRTNSCERRRCFPLTRRGTVTIDDPADDDTIASYRRLDDDDDNDGSNA